MLRSQKKYAEAKAILEKALDRQRQLYGDSPTSVLMLLNLGRNARESATSRPRSATFGRRPACTPRSGAAASGENRDLPGLYLETINAAVQATPPTDRP